MNYTLTPTPRTSPEFFASHAGLLWHLIPSDLLTGGVEGESDDGTWLKAGGAYIAIPDGEHTAWLVDLILAGQPYNMDKINRGDPGAMASLRSVLEVAPPHVAGGTDLWVRTYDDESECWVVEANLTGQSVVVMKFYGIRHHRVSWWVCGLLPRALKALA